MPPFILSLTPPLPPTELELAALAAKEDEGVGSGYESDSESAVSCCTDDMLNDYLGNVYGESSDLEREVDSAAADSLGSPKINGKKEEEREGEESLSLCEGTELLLGGLGQEALVEAPSLGTTENIQRPRDVALHASTQPVPIVSLTPAEADEMEQERLMLTESNEQDQLNRVDSASGSPNSSLGLGQLRDHRSGSESSDREDTIFSRSRWRNPFLSNSPTSDFSLRQRRWVGERKQESGDGVATAERKEEEVPTFTLAIVSRRSRHRAGQ